MARMDSRLASRALPTSQRVGMCAKFHLVELSLLSSTKWNLAFLPHESASPPPPKAPRTHQLGFLGPWVPMGAPLLPPLLLCPTPEYHRPGGRSYLNTS